MIRLVFISNQNQTDFIPLNSHFFSAVTSVISITIFGFGLEQKPCMDRLPWNLMELIYPVFMVILLGCAAIGTDVHSPFL